MNAAPPITAPITPQEFAAWITPLAPAFPLAVAVSGGADSLCLTLLAAAWAQANGGHLTALTVDHALRPESAREARQVADWLAARAIPHRTLRWDHAPPAGNLQAHARTARYGLMAQWCRANCTRHLLTAHHRDDQAETVLLRLKRGSGVDGLAAIAPRSQQHGLTLLRPLLSVPKRRLIATLTAQGQPWLEDPSNQNAAYDRVRLRALLAALPQSETVTAQLAVTAARLHTLREGHAETTADFMARHVQCAAHNAILPAPALLALPPEAAIRVLGALLMRIGNTPHPPRHLQIARLLAQLRTHAHCRRTLGGCLIHAEHGHITIRPERA